jgi:tetratricopeptide (TPR) repeat protein
MALSPHRRRLIVSTILVLLLIAMAIVRNEQHMRVQSLQTDLRHSFHQPTWEESIVYYQDVLNRDPENLAAMKALGGVYLELKKFDQAREYERKAMRAAPTDPEPYYSIAVIDWTQTNQSRMQALKRMEEPMKNASVCKELKAKNIGNITEGIEMVQHALELRSAYDDAMVYMGLLWCEKAYIECGDRAASKSDLKKADEWINGKKSRIRQDDDPKREKVYFV